MLKAIRWLAKAMCKPGFVVFFLILLVVWINFNVWAPPAWRIDEWPFQGLNLFMSALASIQATVMAINAAMEGGKTDQIIQHMDAMTTHTEQIAEHLEAQSEEQARTTRLIFDGQMQLSKQITELHDKMMAPTAE